MNADQINTGLEVLEKSMSCNKIDTERDSKVIEQYRSKNIERFRIYEI